MNQKWITKCETCCVICIAKGQKSCDGKSCFEDILALDLQCEDCSKDIYYIEEIKKNQKFKGALENN